MKTWNKPEIEELNVQETAHNWTGFYSDGGYIGDGVISGHLSWDKPAAAATPSPVAPTDPTEALS